MRPAIPPPTKALALPGRAPSRIPRLSACRSWDHRLRLMGVRFALPGCLHVLVGRDRRRRLSRRRGWGMSRLLQRREEVGLGRVGWGKRSSVYESCIEGLHWVVGIYGVTRGYIDGLLVLI